MHLFLAPAAQVILPKLYNSSFQLNFTINAQRWYFQWLIFYALYRNLRERLHFLSKGEKFRRACVRDV